MTMSKSQPLVSRRKFLQTATLGVGTAAGTLREATVQTDEQPVVVEVDNYYFKGATESPLYITPGTTVKFVWKSGGHNIHVDSQPAAADWNGHEPLEGPGFVYKHTFTVKGRYHFWCVPHADLGMVGDIIVTKADKSTTGGDNVLLTIIGHYPVAIAVSLIGIGSLLFTVVWIARQFFEGR